MLPTPSTAMAPARSIRPPSKRITCGDRATDALAVAPAAMHRTAQRAKALVPMDLRIAEAVVMAIIPTFVGLPGHPGRAHCGSSCRQSVDNLSMLRRSPHASADQELHQTGLKAGAVDDIVACQRIDQQEVLRAKVDCGHDRGEPGYEDVRFRTAHRNMVDARSSTHGEGVRAVVGLRGTVAGAEVRGEMDDAGSGQVVHGDGITTFVVAAEADVRHVLDVGRDDLVAQLVIDYEAALPARETDAFGHERAFQLHRVLSASSVHIVLPDPERGIQLAEEPVVAVAERHCFRADTCEPAVDAVVAGTGQDRDRRRSVGKEPVVAVLSDERDRRIVGVRLTRVAEDADAVVTGAAA